MSSIATQLVDGIALSSASIFGKYENRLSVYPILSNALTSQNIVNGEELQELRTTTGRPVKIPVQNRGTGVLGTGRACTITGSSSTSAMVTVAWVTRSYTFQIIVDDKKDNYISYQKELANNLTDTRKLMYAQFESDLIASLETLRMSTNPHPLFNTGSDTLEVPNADRNALYDYIFSAMELKDLRGRYTVFSNTTAGETQRFLSRQGAGNATNLAPQLEGFDLYRSNRIALGVGQDEVHYVMPNGALAFIPWNFTRQKQVAGVPLAANIIRVDTDLWLQQADDVYPINWDIHYQRACSMTALDGTRNAGNPATVDLYEVSMDYAILTPYASPAGNADTVILKTALLS